MATSSDLDDDGEQLGPGLRRGMRSCLGHAFLAAASELDDGHHGYVINPRVHHRKIKFYLYFLYLYYIRFIFNHVLNTYYVTFFGNKVGSSKELAIPVRSILITPYFRSQVLRM